MKHKTIAEIAYNVCKAYCESIGDNSRPEWKDTPRCKKESIIAGVKFHSMDDRTLEESHESWLRIKIKDGWKYGKKKDPENKIHPCLVSYDKLSIEQKTKNYIFRAAVRQLLNI